METRIYRCRKIAPKKKKKQRKKHVHTSHTHIHTHCSVRRGGHSLEFSCRQRAARRARLRQRRRYIFANIIQTRACLAFDENRVMGARTSGDTLHNFLHVATVICIYTFGGLECFPFFSAAFRFIPRNFHETRKRDFC